MPFYNWVQWPPYFNHPFYALLPAGHPWAEMETIDTKLLNDKSLLRLCFPACLRAQVLEVAEAVLVVIRGRDHCLIDCLLD